MHLPRVRGGRATGGCSTVVARRPSGGRRRPLTAVAVVALLALTGCADAGAPSAPLTPGTGERSDDPAHPDVPLLQVHVRGGFVPMGWDFASVPGLTVYEDGRAITHGPQIAIYPPPILPHLLEVPLDAPDLDALVTAARDAGLLADVVPGYGRPPVADAPTTYVTLHVEGRTYAHAAEALGMVDDLGPSDAQDVGPAAPGGPPVDRLDPGLTPEERAARVALAGFVTRAHELVGAAGAGEPYEIQEFAVMARPAPAGDADAQAGDPAAEDPAAGASPAVEDPLVPGVVAWPLAVALPADGDCLVVSGADARSLRDALAGLGSGTRFERAGVPFDVWFRPLLPHEEGCAA